MGGPLYHTKSKMVDGRQFEKSKIRNNSAAHRPIRGRTMRGRRPDLHGVARDCQHQLSFLLKVTIILNRLVLLNILLRPLNWSKRRSLKGRTACFFRAPACYACRARCCCGKSVCPSVRYTLILYRNECTYRKTLSFW